MVLAKLIASKDPSVIPPEILSAAQSTAVKTLPKEKKEKVTTPAEEEEEDPGIGSLFG